MKRTVGALILLSLMVPLAIQAQEAPQVRPGDRVRVTAPECHLKRQKGTLISLDQNLVLATVGNEDIECPIGDLTRLDVVVGQRKWWKASLVGMGVGVGFGATGGLVAVLGNDDNDALLALLALPIWGACAGLVLGTVAGVARGADIWKEVPLPLIRPFFGPSLDGHVNLGIGLSVHFRR